MFDKSTQRAQEVIFFFDDDGVSKEMMYTEFEAVLDGIVGLTEFADKTVYCVFAVINPGLRIQAVVFFTIDFDSKGEPPLQWNIPFHSLIQKASKVAFGPFETKVVCRSSCSVDWHRDALWDPSEQIVNSLILTIEVNRLCLSTEGVAELVSQNGVQFMPTGAAGQNTSSQQVANLSQLANEVAQTLAGGNAGDPAKRALERELGETIKTLTNDLHLMTQRASELEQKNMEMREAVFEQKSTLKEQMQSLEAGLNERIKQAVTEAKQTLKEKYERKLKTYEQEYKSRFSTKVSQIKSSASVSEHALHEKSELLAQKDSMLAEKAEKLAEQAETIRQQQQSLADNKKAIDALEQKVKQLSEELGVFRKEKLRLMANGADKFFKRLEESGLNFIAYHPGAGHVSVSVSRVGEYLDNPPAFAAEKVGLSAEAYLYWLHHYEKPCCEAPIMGGKICGQKIQRHENPRDFSPGISDRCERHRTGVSAAGRVFSS